MNFQRQRISMSVNENLCFPPFLHTYKMAPPDFVKIAKRTFELGWCHENRVTTKALYLVCMRLSLIPRTLSDKNTHPNSGAIIRFRSDGGIFNLQHLNAWTKVSLLLLRELLFADDCALIAHTEDELQSSLNDVARAASHYGLTISITKTEVMLQPKVGSSSPRDPVI